MKVKKYAISVQWGQGIHYFLTYADTPAEAKERAIGAVNLAARSRSKRGARPKVYVWKTANKEVLNSESFPLVGSVLATPSSETAKHRNQETAKHGRKQL